MPDCCHSRLGLAVQMANLVAWLARTRNTTRDAPIGWGHGEVTFTTHAANGLTKNDLICAAWLNVITDH